MGGLEGARLGDLEGAWVGGRLGALVGGFVGLQGCRVQSAGVHGMVGCRGR